MSKSIRLLVLMVVGFLFCCESFGADPSLWRNLKPGPHQVGFTTKLGYDYSRTYRAKYDYEGVKQTGERARPMQIAIWYPAEKTAASKRMLFNEYVHLASLEEEFGELTPEKKKAAEDSYLALLKQGAQAATDQGVKALYALTTNATRDSSAVKGKFPLIVYAPGSNGGTYTNTILCEYLASHGYIVASMPSLGTYTRTTTIDLVNFYTYMQDIEFTIGSMQTFPNVDRDGLGIVGFSMGGSAATLVQMRNTDIDAVVYLDTGLIFGAVEGLFRPASFFNKNDLRAAQLYLTRGDAPGVNINFIDTIPLADTYSILFNEGYVHGDFVADGMYAAVVPGFTAKPRKPDPGLLYETVSRYTLEFFNAHVKNMPDSKTFLMRKASEQSLAPDFFTLEVKNGVKGAPREIDFMQMIRSGKLEEAKAAWKKVRSEVPTVQMFKEDPMNTLGYESMGGGDLKRAIDLFTLTVEGFPQSANAFDSLSEAHEAAGNIDLAIKNAEKALVLLEKDREMDPGRRDLIKQSSEAR